MESTYTSPAEAARLIRTALKSRHGWTSRQVSVRSDSFSMGSSIDIKIKAPGISIAAVQEIAREQESISRCEITGEILSSGNRYVSVELDWGLVRDEGKKLVAWVEETPIHPSELREVEVCGETYYIGRTHETNGYSVRSSNSGYIPTAASAGSVAEFFARVMIQAGVEVAPPPASPEAPMVVEKMTDLERDILAEAREEAARLGPVDHRAPGGCLHYSTRTLLSAVQEADQDFEWYPTTSRMVEVVSRHLDKGASSLLDIGAGDGRVLHQLAQGFISPPSLYAIEKSTVLIQAQPSDIIPIGTDLFEQNLTSLPIDYIFCNPPYSDFETWTSFIIESGYARRAYLILPTRWKDSPLIFSSLKKRGATSRILHTDSFLDAPRKARAIIDIVEVSYPKDRWGNKPLDPFDTWFDQNVGIFEEEEKSEDYEATHARENQELARIRSLSSITEMVAAYQEEYARMEANYRAIFSLDYSLLKELGVNKENVREGIKKKMAGLKGKYWEVLFQRLDTITNRLSTSTKQQFLERLLSRNILAFTEGNAYSIVIWAIKNANLYFDQQTTQLFLDLSTFEGVGNYKSNVRTWKEEDWRFSRRYREDEYSRPSHYALDYRIVLEKYRAIGGSSSWDYPSGLSKGCHEIISDIIAVLFNLGFPASSPSSMNRDWSAGEWQNWYRTGHPDEILFQVKGYKNGNLHLRFHPQAIKALNVEAGRLLGWLKEPRDVVRELRYSEEEAKEMYRCTRTILPGTARLLLGTGEGQ